MNLLQLFKTGMLVLIVTTTACTQQKKKGEELSPAKADKVDLIAILDTVQRMEGEPLVMRDEMMRKHGDDSDEFRKYQAIYEKNHVINEAKVLSILENGWPSNEEIGESQDRTIADVLQHCELEIRLKYLPMMKQAVKDGLLNPQLLVRAEDRIATDRNEPQIYGGQMKFYPETKSFNVWPVIDPVNIDQRRAEIGLPPIAEHLKNRFDFEWVLEDQIKRTEAFLTKGINKADL